jgi:hypothetical protein
MTTLQASKQFVIMATDLAKDALHVHIGLLVFFAAALLLRWPLRSGKPWAAAFAAALAGEIWDLTDMAASGARFDLAPSWHDLWNTMVWPTVITILARTTGVMSRR